MCVGLRVRELCYCVYVAGRPIGEERDVKIRLNAPILNTT